MKTFKQFMEKFIKTNATPKGTFTYPYDTREGGIFDKIRTKDAIDYENAEFLRNTGIPIDLTKKKKYTGKIDSDVLKAYPELNPDKPGDYTKLKRLTAKLKKA